MGKNNAKMFDPSIYAAAGIDLKTGLPLRLLTGAEDLKNNMRKIMRIIDEQDAVTRYKWYNLPCDLSSEELERLLYYKGQLCFFYMEENKTFYFMPYALDGSIDFYGRYNSVHPVPMAEGTENPDGTIDTQRELLSKKRLTVVKGVKDINELTEEDLKKSTVLLYDYSKQLSQLIIPRQQINDPLLDIIAEIPCFLRTALIASTGVKGMRVADADAKSEVKIASAQILECALTGNLATPITAPVEIQELFEGGAGKSQEFLLSMQALENFRLSTYGLENGGLFEKKAHKLEEEQDMNSSTVGLVYTDGLKIRQNFCNIVNSIWGLSIWCDVSEAVLGADNDGDGRAYDENMEGQNSGEDTSYSDEGGQQ